MQWIEETTTTTGTGDLTLSEVTGRARVSTLVGLNIPVPYVLRDGSTSDVIEAGIGYLSATSTFVRAKVYTTNSSGTIAQLSVSPVSLASGTKHLYVSFLSQSVDTLVPMIGNAGGEKSVANGALSGPISAGSYNDLDQANRLNVHPWLHKYGGPVDAFIFDVSAAHSTKIARLGMYAVNTSTGGPGSLIFEGTSSVSVGTTGNKVVTFSATVLPPGAYYLAIWADSTTATLTGTSVTGNNSYFSAPWGVSGSTAIAASGYALSVSASGGLPTTFPALGGVTPNMKMPHVRLRVV